MVNEIYILVILTALALLNVTIYLLKLGKGKVERKIYSCRSLDKFPCSKDNILMLHAISGCDTASCLSLQGKSKIKLFEENKKFQQAAEVFKIQNQMHETIFVMVLRVFYRSIVLQIKYQALINFDTIVSRELLLKIRLLI